MKLRIISDLHLDFEMFYLNPLPDDGETTLVLAGDICPFIREDIIVDYLTDCSARFKNVVYVPGNHEFEDQNILTSVDTMRSMISDLENVHILSDDSFCEGDVLFIGSTLWTDFDNGRCVIPALRHTKDYRSVYYNTPGNSERLLVPQDSIEFHENSKRYIQKIVNENMDKKIVVITHHAPTYQSMHSKYADDYKNVNGTFYSNLDHIIRELDCHMWIHGHTHNNIDYNIHNTRIISNQKGYLNENKEFDEYLVINV